MESIANVDLTLSGTKENLFSGRASNRVPSARSKEIRRVKLLAADPRAKGWTEIRYSIFTEIAYYVLYIIDRVIPIENLHFMFVVVLVTHTTVYWKT